jgi:hypothetical protein
VSQRIYRLSPRLADDVATAVDALDQIPAPNSSDGSI